MCKFGVIIDIKRLGHLLAAPAVIQQNQGINPTRQPVRRRAIPCLGDHVQAVVSKQKSGANHRSEKNPESGTWQENYRIVSDTSLHNI
jgi:hypothetical protein